MDGQLGDSTRSVKATASQRVPGLPVAPPPVPVAAYHLSDDESDGLDFYGRNSNPAWSQLESALAELEGAISALTFSSGMAAISSALRVLASLVRSGKPASEVLHVFDPVPQLLKNVTDVMLRIERGVIIIDE